jgi:hypothetical protein
MGRVYRGRKEEGGGAKGGMKGERAKDEGRRRQKASRGGAEDAEKNANLRDLRVSAISA